MKDTTVIWGTPAASRSPTAPSPACGARHNRSRAAPIHACLQEVKLNSNGSRSGMTARSTEMTATMPNQSALSLTPIRAPRTAGVALCAAAACALISACGGSDGTAEFPVSTDQVRAAAGPPMVLRIIDAPDDATVGVGGGVRISVAAMGKGALHTAGTRTASRSRAPRAPDRTTTSMPRSQAIPAPTRCVLPTGTIRL